MKVFEPEHINSIKKDLRLWLGEDYANSFDRSKDKAKWFLTNQDALLTNDQFVKKYDIDALISVDTKPMQFMYSRYPNFDKLTENQIKRFEASTNISKSELKKYYNFEKERKEAMDKFNEARYAELNKLSEEDKRARDNSYYNSPVANEYARKHYIQGHPVQAAINEAAGKVAAGVDFLPFPFSLGGPSIRTAQKWAADEDVATPGTGADWGGGALGLFGKIPGVKEVVRGTTGRIARLFERNNSPRAKEISTILNSKARKEAEQIAKKDLEILSKDLDALTDKELLELYKSTDNTAIKQRIEEIHKLRANVEYNKAIKERIESDPSISYVADAPGNAVERTEQAALDYENAVKSDILESSKQQPILEVKAGVPKERDLYNAGGDFKSYYKDVPMEDIATYQMSHVDKPSFISKAIAEGILGIGRKTAGQSVAHRNWNEINYKPDYNEDKAINEIIRMYSNDWKYGKPANYNEPLIKAAYDKWLNDQYMKGNYDVLYRMGEI